VRLGYEKDAEKKNRRIYTQLNKVLAQQIDEVGDRVSKLKEEQEKDIIRKFNSELAKMKKNLEERKSSKAGGPGGNEPEGAKDRENEL
jgi:gas vesicle protein